MNGPLANPFTREEIQGVVARFLSLKTGEIEEKALNVGESGRSAKDIFAFVRETLEDCAISLMGLYHKLLTELV